MVTVVGANNTDRAEQVQASIVKRMGSMDLLVHICEPACAAAVGTRLRNMIEMPMSMGSVYSFDGCRRPDGRTCTGYHVASLKYLVGLVKQVRFLGRNGAQWWLVKDDDTYVHTPNLVNALSRRSNEPNSPWKELVSYAADGCNKKAICGGSGWVLSGALAEKLVFNHGDSLLRFQMEHIKRKPVFHYDVYVYDVVAWVRGARLEKISEMVPYGPMDKRLCGRTASFCIWTEVCNCCPSRTPATWHLNRQLNDALQRLDSGP